MCYELIYLVIDLLERMSILKKDDDEDDNDDGNDNDDGDDC